MTKINHFLIVAVLFLFSPGAGCNKGNLAIFLIGGTQIGVGQTLVIDVCATGAEGQTVAFTFNMPDLPSSGAQLSPSDATCAGGAAFRWTPKSEHVGFHQVTFYASAGGSSDTETVTIEVTASSSAPVFLQPGAGGTYDLSRDPCVNVHIEVKDDDSDPAVIRIFEKDPPIEGGQMTQSGKTADWHWCPSPQQLEANDRYTLMLMAQDESHDPVSHDFIIVLRGAGKDDCPGAAPAIVSNSPPPPDTVASSRDYAVTATITDDRGIKQMPILYYSFDPPANPAKPDVTAFQQVMFESQGGDVYTAYIPNPGLDPQTTRTVYCVISVTDNDDEEGVLCDHRVDSALFQFNITGGSDAPGGYCERCSANAQCASNACVVATYPFCGAACAECPGLGGECRDVTVMGGLVLNLCVPAGLSCSGSTICTDDMFEQNDTRAAAAPVTANVYTGLVICPRDEDFYSFAIGVPSSIDVMIDGWNAGIADIDLQLLKPDGSILRTSAGLDDVEEVQACVAETGTYTIRVYGILDDTGPYTMLLDTPAGSCCVDDGYEPNNSYSAATFASTSTLVEGIICPSDSDWFSIYAGSGQKLNADLLIEGSADLDLELYDTDGLRRLDGSYGTDFMEHVEHDVAAAGYYYARVFGYGAATSGYSLEFSLGTSSGCSSTFNCPAGTVCNGSACIDDTCTPPDGCPAGHFCPTPGGSDWISDCVDSCSSSSSCRDGYACKAFPEGSGCAGTGYGLPGDACFSFRSCSGEMTCLSWPGGYCAEMDCLWNSDCPAGSYCVDVTPGFVLGLCVKDCWASDDLCRLSAGYTCQCVMDLDDVMRFVCLAPGTSATSCY
jgi:hypothetical protein